MATYEGAIAQPVEFRPEADKGQGLNLALSPQCGGGTVVYNITFDATLALINANAVVVSVPVNRRFRLIDAMAVAYGGAVTGLTLLELVCGATVLVSYAQTNLTENTLLKFGDTGVTLLAAGASFSAQTADVDLQVTRTVADAETATGVRFIITYALD